MIVFISSVAARLLSAGRGPRPRDVARWGEGRWLSVIDESLRAWLADDGREGSFYLQVRTAAPMETALAAVNTALARISAALELRQAA